MANLNRVLLIGRLTRDPESRTIPTTGTKLVRFGLAVNNPRRNATTGAWEDNPVFVDIEVWNPRQPIPSREMPADRAERQLRKGRLVFIEGRLRLDQWTGQDGQKRSRLLVVADRFQLLDFREEPVPLINEGTLPEPGPGTWSAAANQPSTDVDIPEEDDIPF